MRRIVLVCDLCGLDIAPWKNTYIQAYIQETIRLTVRSSEKLDVDPDGQVLASGMFPDTLDTGTVYCDANCAASALRNKAEELEAAAREALETKKALTSSTVKRIAAEEPEDDVALQPQRKVTPG